MSGRELLEDILRQAIKKGASDIHLKAGVMPVIRKFGRLRPISMDAKPLTTHEIDDMAFSILDEVQKDTYRKLKQIDLGFGVKNLGRFRINIFRQRGTTRIVARAIAMDVPLIDDLKLPSVIKNIAEMERGLILVTGVTGSGKSTTLAAMIDHINRSTNKHIITIEDPIEYLIRDRKSIISQREIGTDSASFAEALRSALRQDPDVILIGEMRDLETMEIALTAAETGHLVLSTLHTGDARETIHRILSVFPPHQHAQIRYQLASILKAVISQRLASRSEDQGFVPAVEILLNNPRVAELIEDPNRTSEILKVIEESDSWGMQSFDQSLMQLVKGGQITFDEALALSTTPEDFKLKFSGISSGDDRTKWSSPDNLEQTGSNNRWHGVQELELETSIYDIPEEEEDPRKKHLSRGKDDSDGDIEFKPRVIKKAAK